MQFLTGFSFRDESLKFSLIYYLYSAVKNSLSLLHNFKVGPTDVEGRELIISKAILIVHVATLNVTEMFSVPESTAFCML